MNIIEIASQLRLAEQLRSTARSIEQNLVYQAYKDGRVIQVRQLPTEFADFVYADGKPALSPELDDETLEWRIKPTSAEEPPCQA